MEGGRQLSAVVTNFNNKKNIKKILKVKGVDKVGVIAVGRNVHFIHLTH